jgi:patched 1 protein
MGLAAVAAFILVALLLFNVWAAVLVIFSIVGTLLQLAGATFALGIKLSAIPAVILIASIGMNVCFTVHVSLVSLTICFLKIIAFLTVFFICRAS